MGNDAEYYIEQKEEEARFKQACEYAAQEHKEKPLLCRADGVGYEDEIWSWEPLNKILGIFSDLHREKKIGSDCFLASSIPIEGDEEDCHEELLFFPNRRDAGFQGHRGEFSARAGE